MNLDFGVILARWPELLMGLGGTLFLALAGMVLALIIGVLGVAIRRSGNRIASGLVIAFVELIRNTPFLVQIFFIFFGLPAVGLSMSANTAALVALVINVGAYGTEIIRAGIESVPQGQIEAGRALGLSPAKIFRYVVLKPALRNIYPSLTSQFIYLMLTSSVVSVISANDLASAGADLNAQTFASFEIYLVLTIMYFLLSLGFSALFAVIRRVFFTYPASR